MPQNFIASAGTVTTTHQKCIFIKGHSGIIKCFGIFIKHFLGKYQTWLQKLSRWWVFPCWHRIPTSSAVGYLILWIHPSLLNIITWHSGRQSSFVAPICWSPDCGGMHVLTNGPKRGKVVEQKAVEGNACLLSEVFRNCNYWQRLRKCMTSQEMQWFCRFSTFSKYLLFRSFSAATSTDSFFNSWWSWWDEACLAFPLLMASIFHSEDITVASA